MTERTIYAALDAARCKFPTIVKNRTNPHFKSRYADLNAVLEAVEGPLRDEGLMIVQRVTQRNGPTFLNTVLAWIEGNAAGDFFCDIPLPEGSDPQKFGSALTYARRYGITTLLGLVTEDDDDGSAAATAPQGQHDQGGTGGGQTFQLPEGWFGLEDMNQAHNRVAALVKSASPEKQEAARVFKGFHGWPMAADVLGELESTLA